MRDGVEIESKWERKRERGGEEREGVDIKSERERKGGVGRHREEGEVKRCMYMVSGTEGS